LLAPRHLIFTGLEGVLADPRNDSVSGAEEALAELARRNIPLVLITSRTRAEVEPVRRKIDHHHPFITENGGGTFLPDGYFNLKVPSAVRTGRYLCIAFGLPYQKVCEALDEVAVESGAGLAGFHDLSAREIADNAGLSRRNAELARDRDFDEPFFFTSADDQAITRFVEAARKRGFDAERGNTFWRLSSGCDSARAVRSTAKLFREATRTRLLSIGIGGSRDLRWLPAVDHAYLLKDTHAETPSPPHPKEVHRKTNVTVLDSAGPAVWSETILKIIS
jgi:mannosyl-3-phosphoglycerate phosphatase